MISVCVKTVMQFVVLVFQPDEKMSNDADEFIQRLFKPTVSNEGEEKQEREQLSELAKKSNKQRSITEMIVLREQFVSDLIHSIEQELSLMHIRLNHQSDSKSVRVGLRNSSIGERVIELDADGWTRRRTS